ncbi:hypothetical protein Sme01_14210 [Sphaerisporangium melleum]|uniref:Uncharacterized protein n=1 Tax=Sphaerisporangium melleum TaxID=321316 RepID=A0A917QUK0_9ACTN|nr:hypothetical protein [Sphaerisporangium melleum]GGK68876.1 hypothetical protein GCM10007964_09810 [Sphaerisporangium melleum]GII68945.1 hypothetical protein Sme01_14210 [Sphaerisporangium melleum]
MTVSQTSRERRGIPSTSESNGDLIQLDTPVVSLHVHRPHMPRMPRMPGMARMSPQREQEMGRAMETAKTFLPPPDRLLYYGGLGALAALGMIEWPIAVAVGIGTVIATRAAGGRRGMGGMQQEGGMQRGRAGRMEMPGQAGEETETPRATRPSRTRTTATTGRTSRTTASRAGTSTSRTGTTTSRARTAASRAGTTASRAGAAAQKQPETG